ncbi:uncharacterized protein LOC133378000 [Rhineura floridana]|uniref:uncharacterized protein LOC133378000 n=1 Tax=Rhineura floridana TaxID=261503 RepID=UPI002AC8511A|nr:uncharacterized protein LOC133378000 [Rhineura floridana]
MSVIWPMGQQRPLVDLHQWAFLGEEAAVETLRASGTAEAKGCCFSRDKRDFDNLTVLQKRVKVCPIGESQPKQSGRGRVSEEKRLEEPSHRGSRQLGETKQESGETKQGALEINPTAPGTEGTLLGSLQLTRSHEGQGSVRQVVGFTDESTLSTSSEGRSRNQSQFTGMQLANSGSSTVSTAHGIELLLGLYGNAGQSNSTYGRLVGKPAEAELVEGAATIQLHRQSMAEGNNTYFLPQPLFLAYQLPGQRAMGGS